MCDDISERFASRKTQLSGLKELKPDDLHLPCLLPPHPPWNGKKLQACGCYDTVDTGWDGIRNLHLQNELIISIYVSIA
jgi:hypothetical protein